MLSDITRVPILYLYTLIMIIIPAYFSDYFIYVYIYISKKYTTYYCRCYIDAKLLQLYNYTIMYVYYIHIRRNFKVFIYTYINLMFKITYNNKYNANNNY